jgi:hypothetical protein
MNPIEENMAFKMIVLATLIIAGGVWADLPKLNEQLGAASVRTKGNGLTVSTGSITRRWQWTGSGFSTVEVLAADGNSVATGAGGASDWDLGLSGKGRLISLKAFRDDDEHFTSEHLAVKAEIAYGKTLQLKYVIWAYPGAPGLRTQLWLKAPGKVSNLQPGISEQLMLTGALKRATAWGYEAGLKADVTPYEILKTDSLGADASIDLRSGLMCEFDGGGLILVKESHIHTKLGKQGRGVATGSFVRRDNHLVVTGLGLTPADVDKDYTFCWANWIIAYAGGDVDAQLSLKQFDRLRYPVNPGRAVFIMANTWGSEDMKAQCLFKAREENVLKEIESCADLGVELLQIDDGWQDKTWAPAPSAIATAKKVKLPKATQPKRKKAKRRKAPAKEAQTDEVSGHLTLLNGKQVPATYDVYPNGFGKVRKAAKAAGIKLGLWHAWRAPLGALKRNFDNGDFCAYKLDFAHLGTKADLDGLYYKARSLVEHSGYTVSVNWDVTEPKPRMGFYFGRDCGNLYLTNRKASTVRERVLYNPWQILRDGWELAHYMNLNKIQLTYQNRDLTPETARTDALKYPHDYNMAITLMSSPILFTETQMIKPEARNAIRPLITAFKRERAEMYKGYVFPIGRKPDNAQWTGFQNHNPDTGNGYLTIFRELNSKDASGTLALHFLKPGAKVQLTDVLSGKTRTATLNQKSEATFELEAAPGFLFLRYTEEQSHLGSGRS